MYIIGLTGGLGSGKTTVGNCFSQLGINVINADIAARKVVEKGSPALTQIVEFFGQQSLLEDGTLNRAFLREEIFNDTNKRQWIETLLHPLIQIWIKQALKNSSSAYTILESPLLLETDQHRLADRILVVDIPKELQIQRSAQRDGNDKQQIQAIMDTQLAREQRLKQADDIIDNSKPLDGLPSKVEALHQTYLKLARKKSHE